MLGKVIAIAAVIIVFIVGNANLLGCLNFYMENSGCNNKRVREPKVLSPFIQHDNINKLSIISASDFSNKVKHDGTVLVLNLVLSVLSLVINISLAILVIALYFICGYYFWWALLIAVGYSIIIGVFYFYYWLKFKKANKK